MATFNDPNYPNQRATSFGPNGIDVDTLYDDGYSGAGIRVGVIDVGVDWLNPELVGQVDTTAGWNAETDSPDSYTPPTGSQHGTGVSRIIAGKANNNLQGVGVAWNSTIVSFKLGDGANNLAASPPANQLELLLRQDEVDISSNSWGMGLFADNFLEDFAAHGAAIAEASTIGRGGLGTVWVRSAGNSNADGDDVNAHNYGNNRFTMTVGAVDDFGNLHAFSGRGSAIWVVTPANATSWSTPLLAGTVALILEANPELGYRDVQTIVALTARPAGGADPWTTNDAEGFANGGGVRTSRGAGFGILDGQSAVRLAETWETAPRTEANILVASAVGTGFVVPDLGSASASVTIAEDMLVERAVLTLRLDHTRIGDLRFILTSPNGTESILLDRVGNGTWRGDGTLDWEFTSNQYFWESSAGTWTLRIEDTSSTRVATVRGWELDLYGAPRGPDDLYVYTDSFAVLAGIEATRQTLTDADGGIDTLNAAAITTGSLIDLTPGGTASLLAGVAVTVAAGTVIEKGFGGSANDTLLGNAADNTLSGERGDDSLAGGEGSDSLDGGPGLDTMAGGAGDDAYRLEQPGDAVLEATGDGNDTVTATLDATLAGGQEIEWLVLAGTAAAATGNEFGNTILGTEAGNTLSGLDGADSLVGGGGTDLLDGGSGSDTLDGGAGDDSLLVDDSQDTVIEAIDGGSDTVTATTSYALAPGQEVETLVLVGAAALLAAGNELNNAVLGNAEANTLIGEAGADSLSGDAGADSLDGGEGADSLDGGPGADTQAGGAGDDAHTVDDALDLVLEAVGEGSDTVTAGVDHALAAGQEVEALVLVGAALVGTGNEFANAITGNAGDNTLTGGDAEDTLLGAEGHDSLDGGTGADSLAGGMGDDAYAIDDPLDLVVEAVGEGADTVTASLDHTLAGGVEIETLALAGAAIAGTGNSFANTILGNGLDNLLDGAAGADTMAGGAGQDLYVVDDSLDLVQEAAGEGDDTILAAVDHALAADQEVETLALTGAAVSGTGNAFANTLLGNALGNLLDGGAGADSLAGSEGDDSYVVDDALDVVTEAAGEGNDTVVASVDFALAEGQSLETLVLAGAALTGSGNSLDNSLVGTAGANTLAGGEGADVLDGGAGADSLAGGAGHDSYQVDDALDLVAEAAGEGDDTVFATADHALTDGQEIETLVLVGAALAGTGNDLANTLLGNAGDNTLAGGGGDDTLTDETGGADSLDGGTGADSMAGGAGDDAYAVDDVLDLVSEATGAGSDTIVAAFDFTLDDLQEIEGLVLAGAALAGTGNALANTILGNGGDNTLAGAAGDDSLAGAGGADWLDGGEGDGDVAILTGNRSDYFVESLEGGGFTLLDLREGAPDGADTAMGIEVFRFADGDVAAESLVSEGTPTPGPDSLVGSPDTDTVDGLEGPDTILGLSGDDSLAGSAGEDSLVGGLGLDTLSGGDDADALFGAEGSDNLSGGLGADHLDGGDDADTLAGEEDADSLLGAAGADSLAGGFGEDSLDGGEGADLLAGDDGADTLLGGDGADSLDGGAGADSMAGGTGDDAYAVDDALDIVAEAAGEGSDTVFAAVDYVLGAAQEVETLALVGAALSGTGNELANTLLGNAGANTLAGAEGADSLDGGEGADSMAGGTGDDAYAVDDALDLVAEAAGEGSDTVFAAVDHVLGAAQEVETLALVGAALSGTGNALANTLLGNAGANTLAGAEGADSLDGGEGGDSLLGDDGADSLEGGIGDDALDGGAEGDLLSGGEDADTAAGGAGGDTLLGGAGTDSLIGGSEEDLLDGGTGADTMAGGLGDDSYVVDDSLDLVLEAPGEGSDTVTASVDHALAEGQEVERLALTGAALAGTGNALANTILGTAGANTLAGGGGDDSLAGAEGDDRLDGAEGADTADGGAGADTLLGGTEADSLDGGAEADSLDGADGADTLVGADGGDTLAGGLDNDSLDGGTGPDSMDGGAGDDRYAVDDALDLLAEASGEGNDTVTAAVDYTLATGVAVETLALAAGTAALSATGNDLANTLLGNAGANTLAGGDGADTVLGDDGTDSLAGGDANDSLVGGAAGDTLDGGAGVDSMAGGIGDDLYVIESAGEVATELAGEGTDTVQSSRTWTLGAELEALVLTGTGNLNGTGNALANALTGNTGANSLSGLDGADTLLGDAGADTLAGGSAEDSLDGGTGADSMNGGAGNDVFVVDDALDRLGEGGGIDTVRASVTWTLATGFENLVLTGAAAIDGTGNTLSNAITGNDAANLLSGGDGNDTASGAAGADTLVGGTGNDSLDGGTGADSMNGGAANDSYVVDDALDVVVEASGGGADTVFAGVTWTLGANVETLVLTGSAAIDGTGNTTNNALTGNSAANRLAGGNGADTLTGGQGDDTLLGEALGDNLNGGEGQDSLDGGTGVDTMAGGLGDDVFVVDGVGDQVIEAAGGGIDTVRSSVTLTLSAEVEVLVLTGTAALNGTGNTIGNILIGNGGSNILSGLDGDDSLTGGASRDTLAGGNGADTLDGGVGPDSLTGGAGADAFRFGGSSEGGDTVADFTKGEDAVWIVSAGFGGGVIPLGALDPTFITFGPSAVGLGPQLVYNAATGHLLWDGDGAGGANAVRFATFTNPPVLDVTDFLIVA